MNKFSFNKLTQQLKEKNVFNLNKKNADDDSSIISDGR